MQPALNLRTSQTPAPVRPVLVTRNGDQLPVRPVVPVSALKQIAGQPEAQAAAAPQHPDGAGKGRALSTVVASIEGAIAAPNSSSLYLAQQIAQQDLGETRPSRAEDEAAFAAYSDAAERGTVFYGLQYPIDFSV